jgi:hypothetical protein
MKRLWVATGLAILLACGVQLILRLRRSSAIGSEKHEQPGSRRDPEERAVSPQAKAELREKMLDKTLADSFPTSDPPSSIPDPSEDDSLTA